MLGSHEERVLMHKNIIMTTRKDSRTLGWHGGHHNIAHKNIPARVSSSNCLFSLGLRPLINNAVKDYCFKISSVIVVIFFSFLPVEASSCPSVFEGTHMPTTILSNFSSLFVIYLDWPIGQEFAQRA